MERIILDIVKTRICVSCPYSDFSTMAYQTMLYPIGVSGRPVIIRSTIIVIKMNKSLIILSTTIPQGDPVIIT